MPRCERKPAAFTQVVVPRIAKVQLASPPECRNGCGGQRLLGRLHDQNSLPVVVGTLTMTDVVSRMSPTEPARESSI
jgi:hypothetical protein